MGLGSDQDICKQAFIAAMRARLEADQPGLGSNVDDPEIQKNLGALGQAVFDILTENTEMVSDQAEDASFWTWIQEINDWLLSLSSWQQEVAQAFAAWMPTQSAEQSLKDAIAAIPDPVAPPTIAPTLLRGRIE